MRIGWIILTCLAPLSAVHAEPLRFDMGTAESELRPGFTRITGSSVYDKNTGYGWRSAEGLKEHDRHYPREWQFSDSRGRTQPPQLYTNEITRDTVSSGRRNAFLVDLPPGDYKVYVLSGLSAGSTRDYHWFDVTAGRSRATVKIPGPYRFERRMLDVTVSGGPLSIEFLPETDWLVASIIIFDVKEEARVRADFLDALEKEIYFLPPDVAEQWNQTEHADPRPHPEFSVRDKERGYALFSRHWSEVVYPNTVPRPSELDPELKTFATLGEYEPVTFSVLPLEDLAGATVSASDLRSPQGLIPKANVDVRSVRYMLVRPNYSSFFSYHVAPDVLEHRASVDLAKGHNQRFWITVRVPDDAKPGVYQGELTFQPGDGQAARVPITLRVLPIRLRKDPGHIYGTYYRDPLSLISESNSPQANDYFRRKAELERQDMVAHGMNSHISSISGLVRDDEGAWTMDGAETERRIALDRKYGLTDKPLVVSFPVSTWYGRLVDKKGLGSHLRLVRPDVPKSFFDEITKMVEAIELEKKKYAWPELLYYPIDEPSTQENSVQFMVGVLEAIKRVPGVRTYITADPTHEQFEPMWPYIDVWCCQPFVFDHEKVRRLSEEKDIEFWCYPNHISGENDHTPIRGARMTFGYGLWKSGFRTLMPWIYQSSGGDPWNYLDSRSMDFFIRSTPDGEPIPVVMWEAYREGIDDGRYLYTLAQLVEEAKKAGPEAAATARKAEKELEFVWNAIEVQEKYKHDGLWSGADFDAYRWLLASEIIRLQEAAAGK